MTFLSLASLYLGITEVCDDAALMLFKPKLYAKEQMRRKIELE